MWGNNNAQNTHEPCRFFIVLAAGPPLLGKPYVKILELLSVSCNTIEPSWKNTQLHKQTMQDKSCINKDFKDNVTIDAKCNNKINLFIAEPDKDAHITASA